MENSTKPLDSEAKIFIKQMLGESNIELELTDADFEVIEKQTLDTLGPYYEGTKYIYGDTSVIDLSNYPEVISVHQAFETQDGSDEFLQSIFFGQPGVYIWSADTMDSYLQYVSLQTLYSNFKPMRSQTWKFIKPYVYLHGFTGQSVILECFVRPMKFSDLSLNSPAYGLAKEYALALAKEIVGRTRSKFTINGAPYALDGQALIQEAQQEKADVLARVVPPIRVY